MPEGLVRFYQTVKEEFNEEKVAPGSGCDG